MQTNYYYNDNQNYQNNNYMINNYNYNYNYNNPINQNSYYYNNNYVNQPQITSSIIINDLDINSLDFNSIFSDSEFSQDESENNNINQNNYTTNNTNDYNNIYNDKNKNNKPKVVKSKNRINRKYKESQYNTSEQYIKQESYSEQNHSQQQLQIKTKSKHFPVILKQDIRRYFAEMYANTINSHNLELIMNFFLTFFSPDFLYINSFDLISPISFIQPTKDSIIQFDVENFLIYLLIQIEKNPDHAMIVDDIKIIQIKDDDHSYLTYKSKLIATEIFEVDSYPDDYIHHSFRKVSSNKSEIINKAIDMNDDEVLLSVRNSNSLVFYKNINNFISKSNIYSIYKQIINKELRLQDILQFNVSKFPRKCHLLQDTKVVFDENNKVLRMISTQVKMNQ